MTTLLEEHILLSSYWTKIMASTTTVSTKGQIILPKIIRDQLDWTPGTRLLVEPTPDGVLLKAMTTTFAPTRPEDVFGLLKYDGPSKSVDEMHEGIAQEVQCRHARGRY